MPVIYETINHYNKKHNISPWKYIGSDMNDNTNYLGSSKRLKEDIQKFGIGFFEKNILLKFDDIDNKELRRIESEILQKRRVREDPNYYNLSETYSPGVGVKGMKHKKPKIVSDEWKESRKGWSPSENTRKIWSKQRTGKKHSEEAKRKMSRSRTGSRNGMSCKWNIVDINQNSFVVTSLKNWCEENNLPYIKVWKNKHPDFRVQKIEIGDKNAIR